MFRKVAFLSLAAAAFAFIATVPANADGNLVLKAYQGYNFTKGSVTKSGDPNADVTFTVNSGHAAAVAIVAKKIKGFGSQVPGISAFNDIKSWPAAVNAPEPGYYVVQGHDGKTIYLMQVTSLGNQSQAASNWELAVFWEKLW